MLIFKENFPGEMSGKFCSKNQNNHLISNSLSLFKVFLSLQCMKGLSNFSWTFYLDWQDCLWSWSINLIGAVSRGTESTFYILCVFKGIHLLPGIELWHEISYTKQTSLASKLTLHLLIFDESILIDSFCHITEEYFRGKRIPMVHYRLSIRTIPAIHYEDKKALH